MDARLAAALLVASVSAQSRPLTFVDDRGAPITSGLRVCLSGPRGESCRSEPPYQLPADLAGLDRLLVEGPRHGPRTWPVTEVVRHVGDRTALAVPRKTRVQVAGRRGPGPVALTLYSPVSREFRDPIERLSVMPEEGVWVPSGEWLASLSTKGLAPVLQILSARPGDTQTLLRPTRPGWSLVVRAVDAESGTAVARARLELSSAFAGTAPEGASRHVLETGASGLAVVNGLRQGFLAGTASAAGYVAEPVAGVSSSDGTFAFHAVHLQRGGTVRFRVLLDGRPPPAARCQVLAAQEHVLDDTPSTRVLFDASADDRGACVATRVPAGEALLRVSLTGQKKAVDRRIEVSDSGTTEAIFDLETVPLRGTVKRRDAPAPGLVVSVHDLSELSGTNSVNDVPGEAVTGEDGTYAIWLWRSGRYWVVLRDANRVAMESQRVFLDRDSGPVDFDVAAEELQGIVVDDDGRALPEARVLLVEARSTSRMATSDGLGRFAFSVSSRGRVEISARKQGYEPSEPMEVDLAPGPVPDVRIVLNKADLIRGRVLTAAGATVGSALVAGFEAARNGVGLPTGVVTSSAAGTFELPRSGNGATRVFFSGPGCPLGFTDAPGRPSEPLELRCASGFSALAVRLIDAEGRPLVHESLYLRWNGIAIPRAFLYHHGRALGTPTESDGSGRLVVVGVSSGHFELFSARASTEESVALGLRAGFLADALLSDAETAELEVRVRVGH